MRLVEFIQTKLEQLLEDWEEAAVEIAPELKGENREAQRDHAKSMMEFIVRDLSTSQTMNESARKAHGKGQGAIEVAADAHAIDRLNQGLTLHQSIQELQALRSRVTIAWSKAQHGLTTEDIAELVQFNVAIDKLVADSTLSYSTRKEQETRLFEAMLRASPDPAAIFAPDGTLLFFNKPMADLTRFSTGDAFGKTPLELGLGFATELDQAIAETVASGEPQTREFHYVLRSGRELYFDSQLVPVFDDRNEVEAVVKTSRNITVRKLAERQVWRSAHVDSLTGIPNRRLFLDRLEQSLLEAERDISPVAVLFIDLDHFKPANDQLGHKAGDKLLKQVAKRLRANVRAVDTVARLGGDEFTLLLKNTDQAGAIEAAKTLLVSLEKPFEVESHQVNLSGSIGVTLFPGHGKTVAQLMHSADQAMYAAKANGGQQVQLYEPWMAQSESEHMRLNKELDEAFRKNQLEVYYQPIVDIRTGAIFSAEALLRWNHPARGLLSPAVFLTIAEQSGLLDRINALVLEQAVTCSLLWQNQSGEAFPININESPASFLTPTLMDQWRDRLTHSELDKSNITMELTSDSLNKVSASGLSLVESFSSAGFGINLAIDDFGIEPISLMALEQINMRTIKLDKELTRYAGQRGEVDRILKAIIAMAHEVKVQVVGVGIENERQLQFLSDSGCDYAQGFLFSKPLPQNDFEALLLRDGRQPTSLIGRH